MILGIKKLHELVREINLVENLCDREKNNPEQSQPCSRSGVRVISDVIVK